MSKANEALDKMAENAREIGIQMQPEEPRAWFTIDELNAWADKKLKENPQWAEQPAQQEPVTATCLTTGNIRLYASVEKTKIDGFEPKHVSAICLGKRKMHKGYTFEFTPSPPAQRTWVGLSDDEKRQLFDREDYQGWLDYINAIEAKLKEKNT